MAEGKGAAPGTTVLTLQIAKVLRPRLRPRVGHESEGFRPQMIEADRKHEPDAGASAGDEAERRPDLRGWRERTRHRVPSAHPDGKVEGSPNAM